jgi:hypothetical protein
METASMLEKPDVAEKRMPANMGEYQRLKASITDVISRPIRGKEEPRGWVKQRRLEVPHKGLTAVNRSIPLGNLPSFNA